MWWTQAPHPSKLSSASFGFGHSELLNVFLLFFFHLLLFSRVFRCGLCGVTNRLSSDLATVQTRVLTRYTAETLLFFAFRWGSPRGYVRASGPWFGRAGDSPSFSSAF